MAEMVPMDDPIPRGTCVVIGGRGFVGRWLVLRLLKLRKWIVRVADSPQSLQLDPSSHLDSALSEAISSGRASYHCIDVRHLPQIVGSNLLSLEFSFVWCIC